LPRANAFIYTHVIFRAVLIRYHSDGGSSRLHRHAAAFDVGALSACAARCCVIADISMFSRVSAAAIVAADTRHRFAHVAEALPASLYVDIFRHG